MDPTRSPEEQSPLALELLQKLELTQRESSVLRAVIVTLLMDLQTARGHRATEPLIIWPSMLGQRARSFGLSFATGKEVFTPEARLAFLHRSPDDVDRAMVLQAVPIQAPSTPTPASAPAEPPKLII